MATWSIEPSSGVTNNGNGTFVFEENSDFCSDRNYTITYTDDSGCTGTTTYTIPRKPAATDISLSIGLSSDHGIGSYGNPKLRNVSGDDEIVWNGSEWPWADTHQFNAEKLLGCKAYSLSMSIYCPDGESPCDCSQTTPTSNDCDNYSECFIRPEIEGNFVSGSWEIIGTPSWEGYYNGGCTLYNATTDTTISISVSPSNVKPPINCDGM